MQGMSRDSVFPEPPGEADAPGGHPAHRSSIRTRPLSASSSGTRLSALGLGGKGADLGSALEQHMPVLVRTESDSSAAGAAGFFSGRTSAEELPQMHSMLSLPDILRERSASQVRPVGFWQVL